MLDYSFVLWSYEPIDISRLKRIISLPCIGSLLFPANIHLVENEQKYLSSADEISIDQLPRSYYSEETDRLHFSIYPLNGMVLTISVASKNIFTPNSLVLKFSEEHISSLDFSIDRVQTILKEVIPFMNCSQAYIYHNEFVTIPDEERGGFTFPQPRYIKNKSGQIFRCELDWISYFGPEAVRILGRSRFDSLLTCFLNEQLYEGILVVLQQEPVKNQDPSQIQRKIQAEKEVGFDNIPFK